MDSGAYGYTLPPLHAQRALQQATKRFPKAAEFCTNARADGHHLASNDWGQHSPLATAAQGHLPESPCFSSHCISLQEKARQRHSPWQCVQVTLTRGVNVSTA
ncbi:receptor-type tyrosine-protein phosphatase V-like [Platysternon megacephalum]|uniref:Receptor-type tyrosine-protein phosphatase V-like n=1 Tax=Platysternon megacephalum TaxID=55544 RepID=A0A4D9DZQ1_9SAUR|nr:receptor-type tyrosine-protein phosphatase V-like [Platysternon megacephalum]